MTPERARELLGGLATGILTPEERQMLFEAALQDQALFNEVGDELEFAAFLQAPETRAQLANRIEVAPERPHRWMLPSRWLALSGALAACAVLFVAVWNRHGESVGRQRGEPVQVAIAPPPAPLSQAVAPKTEAAKVQPQPAAPPKKPIAPPAATVASTEALQARTADAAVPRKAPETPAQSEAKPVDQASANLPQPSPAQQHFAPQALSGVGGAAPAMRAKAIPPAAPTPAPPPVVTASLAGTVHDPSGAPIRNATIHIVNSTTRETISTSSDSAGRFAAPPLAPGGPYDVIVQAPGFKREDRSGITLAANQPNQLDIPLQVGMVADTVEVSSAGSLLKANTQQAAQQRRVAVLDFVNGTPQDQSGQQAADLLSTQLLDRGQVEIIARDKVRQAQASGRAPSTKEAAALGRKIGADAVVVGSVQSRDKDQAGADVAVTAQVIDTKKARSFAKVSANGSSLRGATNLVGLQLESQLALPLVGAVTRVDSGLVTVLFQGPAEPRIGARLDVYRGKRKIGELTLTSSYGQTGAGAYSGNDQPRKGDHVTSSR